MNKRSSAVLAVAATSSLLLSACGSGSSHDTSGPRVVAASYPFAYVAQQVAGDNVTVDNLTNPGAEPHDIELKPRQVADVQNADLLVFSGGFQPAVDDAEEQADLADKSLLDVTKIVEVLRAGDDNGHVDPHTWLNPLNQIKLADAVAKKLAVLDPDNAATYTDNAATLTTQLTTLDADFSAGLKDCDTRTIVTSHAAFAYLADRYGLLQVAIAGLNPSAEPSPSQLAAITALVRKEKVTTIFTEALVSPAIAKTVANETGAALATLDPIEGLSDKTIDENYITLMRKNLQAIEKANNCS